jgi:hypothetical protein
MVIRSSRSGFRSEFTIFGLDFANGFTYVGGGTDVFVTRRISKIVIAQIVCRRSNVFDKIPGLYLTHPSERLFSHNGEVVNMCAKVVVTRLIFTHAQLDILIHPTRSETQRT